MSPERWRTEDVGITNGDTGFWVIYRGYQLKSLSHQYYLTCHDIYRNSLCMKQSSFQPTQRDFIDRREEIRTQRTPEELEAEIKRLVGTETAELLLGKKTMDDLVQEKVAQQEKASIVN